MAQFLGKLTLKPADTVKQIVWFALIITGFHILWKLGSGWFEGTAWYVAVSDFTTRQVYLASARVNEVILGGVMTREDVLSSFRFRIAEDGSFIVRTLIIDHTCSGLKQFYQAFFLFLIYPGPVRHKLWFIPASIMMMHLVNIFRVVVLSLAMVYTYGHWLFIHDWVLRPFFYVVLFGLWVIWNEVFYLNSKRP